MKKVFTKILCCLTVAASIAYADPDNESILYKKLSTIEVDQVSPNTKISKLTKLGLTFLTFSTLVDSADAQCNCVCINNFNIANNLANLGECVTACTNLYQRQNPNATLQQALYCGYGSYCQGQQNCQGCTCPPGDLQPYTQVPGGIGSLLECELGCSNLGYNGSLAYCAGNQEQLTEEQLNWATFLPQ